MKKKAKSKSKMEGWHLCVKPYEFNVVNGIVEEVAVEGQIFKSTRNQTKKEYYKSVFDALMHIAITNKRIPKGLLEAFDEVADLIGDVATGRRK